MNLVEADEYIKKTIREHLGDDWKHEYFNARTILGQCCYRIKTIKFSRHFINVCSNAQLRQTTLHEVAHALEPGAKHGYKWKVKCIELGIEPKRTTKINMRVAGGRRYQCPICKKEHRFYRKLRYKYHCTICRNRGYSIEHCTIKEV